MVTLSLLDLILITIYVIIILYLGYRSSKKETSEGFLLSDRNLGVLTNTATIVSSKTGAGLVLTFVALVYLYGTSAMWFFIGAAFGYFIFILFATKLRKKSTEEKFYTLSDYFFHKYGKKVGFISAFVILVVMLLNFIIQLIGGTKVLGSLTGFSFIISLSLISITILIYLVMGGFKAVVKTDIAQFLAIIILAGLLGILLFSGVKISPSDISFGALPLKITIGFFLFGIILPFASAELWQRVYAAKDVKTIKKSLMFSALFYILIGVLFSIVGLAIKSKVAGIDPDIALIEGFIRLLPAGLIGLGVVTIFAAVMSSADTYLFTTTSILLQDFYSRFKKINDKKLVTLFRCALIVLMLVGFIIAILLQNIMSTVFIFTGFASVMALTGIASWLVKKVKGKTLTFGMVIGFLGTLICIFTKPVTEAFAFNSVIFTLGGFFIGGIYNLISKKKESQGL